MTRLAAGAATDVGLVRANNQDNLLVAELLYAVADGMGGHAAGEVASETAVGALQSAFGHLVTITDDGQPIRQSARWDVIPGGAHRVIKELIRRRLMRARRSIWCWG